MARALWSGSLTFGLVNVPVHLAPAVRDKGVHFHLLSPDGKCRLRQKLYCPDTGEEFDFSQAVKGYEVSPGEYVLVEKEELARMKPTSGKTIEITQFVDASEIDPALYARPYYLLPDAKSGKAYRLLLEAIRDSGKVGVARFVMRMQAYWAVIRPHGKLLILYTMRYPDEVVADRDVAPSIEGRVDKRELDAAEQLIDALVTEFDPGRYTNEYASAVRELVERPKKGKGAGREKVVHEEAAPRGDLLDALKRSVHQAQRDEPRRRAPTTRKKAPRRRAKSR
jgi:DNA end-binding protein Ku